MITQRADGGSKSARRLGTLDLGGSLRLLMRNDALRSLDLNVP
jgi:hypothetical protein